LKRLTALVLLLILLCTQTACEHKVSDTADADISIGGLQDDRLHGDYGDKSAENAGIPDDATNEESGGAEYEPNIEIADPIEPVLAAESETGTDSVPVNANAPDLTGLWHLDPSRNNLSEFPSLFECYGEFGASMEIRSSGQMSWYIGAEGGEGTFSIDGSLLTASLARTLDESNMTTEFDILHDGDEIISVCIGQMGLFSGTGVMILPASPVRITPQMPAKT
jgi:hypothetical protein